MFSNLLGSIGGGLLGSAAIASDSTLATGGIVLTGLGFVAVFIRHLLAEIKRLTERLDEAKARSDRREEQMEELRRELREIRKCNCNDQ